MIKILYLIFLLNLSTISFAQDEESPLKGLEVVSEATPYELEMIIDHLKTQVLSEEQVKIILSRLNLINNDLVSISNKDLMFLFKAEIYKGVLNNQYLNLENKMQVNSSVLNRIKTKLAKNTVIYSKFSTWIASSVIADLEQFNDKNFLDRFQNVKRSNTEELLKAKKLVRVIKFTGPILEAFYSLIPEKFNSLATNISIDILDRLSKKTYYFKKFQGQLSPEASSKVFSIPDVKVETKKEVIIETPTLEEEQKDKKLKAQKIIEKLEDEDLSGLSDAIDKIEPEKQ